MMQLRTYLQHDELRPVLMRRIWRIWRRWYDLLAYLLTYLISIYFYFTYILFHGRCVEGIRPTDVPWSVCTRPRNWSKTMWLTRRMYSRIDTHTDTAPHATSFPAATPGLRLGFDFWPSDFRIKHADYRERKCADTIDTVLVPWAGHFQW